GRAVDKKSFLRGLILGVPNFFSSFFLLSALKKLNASFVYPAVSISVILLTAFSSRFLWGEKISKYGKIAIIIGGVAIIFLI
ncbi:EamA family transporter, partial [bacterium]|nr:EamA family transporter [bacterium]